MSSLKFKVLSVLSIFFLAGWALADIDANVKKTFDVKPGGNLVIDADFGSIEVTTHSSNQVQIEVYRKIDAFTQKEAERILEDLELTIKQDGNDVFVNADYLRDGFNWGKTRIKLRFVAVVPKEYNVDLKTAGGSISVDDLDGKVVARTSGGSLQFGNINGPVDGRTSGGSITLEGCNGDADVHTSGGSINIGKVDGSVKAGTSGGSITINRANGTVEAKTSGGSINVDEVMGDINASTSGGGINAKISAQPRGDCRLSTSGGSVNVYMFDDIKVDVDAKTSGGRVKTDFPVTIQGEIKKNQLQAKINDGGPLLHLRTSGGNINLNKM